MAMYEALNKVGGDLSNGQAKFKNALAYLTINAPNGKISLDGNRQAIGTNFVTEVIEDAKGGLVSKVVNIVSDVHQTLGYPNDVFAKIGPPSPDNPQCKKYGPDLSRRREAPAPGRVQRLAIARMLLLSIGGC